METEFYGVEKHLLNWVGRYRYLKDLREGKRVVHDSRQYALDAYEELVRYRTSHEYASWEPGYDRRADVSPVKILDYRECFRREDGRNKLTEITIWRVLLTELDIYIAEKHAALLRADAKKDKAGYKGYTHGQKRTHHLIGSVSEQAFSKAVNIWNRMLCNTYKTQADFGNVDIKTCYDSGRKLIVCEEDNDDWIFVLVRPAVGEWTEKTRYQARIWDVVGWIRGKEAKEGDHPRCLREGSNGFLIKDFFLNPIETLPPREYQYWLQNRFFVRKNGILPV